MDMACPQASTHVWWDLYNPTPAVNSLIADSAWSGQPLSDICHPISVQELAISSLWHVWDELVPRGLDLVGQAEGDSHLEYQLA